MKQSVEENDAKILAQSEVHCLRHSSAYLFDASPVLINEAALGGVCDENAYNDIPIRSVDGTVQYSSPATHYESTRREHYHGAGMMALKSMI